MPLETACAAANALKGLALTLFLPGFVENTTCHPTAAVGGPNNPTDERSEVPTLRIKRYRSEAWARMSAELFTRSSG